MCLQTKFNLLDEKSTLPLHERPIVSTSFCDFYIKKRRAAGDSKSGARHGSAKAARSSGRAAWVGKSGEKQRARSRGGKDGAKRNATIWG